MKQANRKANRRIRLGNVIRIVAVLSAIAAGLLAREMLQTAQQERIKSFSLASTASLNSNQELDALLAALKAATQLNAAHRVDTQTRSSVQLALQRVMFQISERNRLEGHNDKVISVSFSPDGQTLATASYDRTIKLWQIGNEEVKTLRANAGKVWSVSFSRDGKFLASGHHDGTIELWNLQGQLLKTIQGHNNYITRVRFSPDGKILASASRDRTIKLWTLDGHALKTFKGHAAGVTGLSFSPDGKTLASTSDEGRIRLWNIETGQQLQTIQGRGYPLWNIQFSSDSKTFVTVSDDAQVEFWNAEILDFEQLIGRGCDWLKDYLNHNVGVEAGDRQICDRIP